MAETQEKMNCVRFSSEHSITDFYTNRLPDIQSSP